MSVQSATRLPKLFDKDTFSRNTGCDLSPLLKKLAGIKKTVLENDDCFKAHEENGAAVCIRTNARSGKTKYGVFCLSGKPVSAAVGLKDGVYENALGGEVTVKNGRIETGSAVIICC